MSSSPAAAAAGNTGLNGPQQTLPSPTGINAGLSTAGGQYTPGRSADVASGGQYTPGRSTDVARCSTDVASGGQYTPRRSTEVSRQELAAPVPGMTYVRLAKAAEPFAVPAAAAGGEGAQYSAAGAAAVTTAGAAGSASSSSSTPPHTPFAGYSAQGGQGSVFSPKPAGAAAAAAAAVPGTSSSSTAVGVRQLVSGELPEQRQQRHQKIVAPIHNHLQQQQQDGGYPTHTSAIAAAAATAAAAAAGPNPPASNQHDKPDNHVQFVVAAAPEGVPDPFAPTPQGNTASEQPPSDPNQPHRADSANTIVAKQPLAPASQQSVLGSRKALRGVTAQQLLVEPIIQSLLSKA